MNKNASGKLQKYKVSIFGESYFLVSDEPEEHISIAAQHIDALMREIAQKAQIVDSKRIAVLVALQLASKELLVNNSADRLLSFVNNELNHLRTL